MRSWRAIARDLVPPALLRGIRRIKGDGIRFVGQYPDWAGALAAAKGYDSQVILEKTRDAALKVVAGEAAYERDSVLFERVEYAFPVIAALLRCACANGGRLRVIDFGGSLGTSYRQFKAFQPALRELRWHVVEQHHYVDCGRAHFENEELRFFETLADASQGGAPDVVLMSGVLQYLEDPRRLIGEAASLPCAMFVLDRTYCTDAADDVLTIQTVPAWIYDASYPCWLLSRTRLLKAFGERFELVASFADTSAAWFGPTGEFALEGHLLARKP